MYTLCCDIKIGTASFHSVNEVTIKRSIHDLGASAVIKVPITALVRQSGQPDAYVETRQQINIGDKVEIRLGYDNKLENEFTGYVRQVNSKLPLEIECEDEYFVTRRGAQNFSKKSTTLKECLDTMLPGIRQATCAELTLKNFSVKNESGAWVLAKLKKDYGLNIYFDVDGQLHAEKYFDGQQPPKTKYRLRYNVIKDTDLKYQMAGDTKYSVKAICFLKNGSTLEGKIGEEEGEQKTFYYYNVNDQNELKELARQEYKKLVASSYKGKIETFLAPYCQPGMAAAIEDPKFEERNGEYFVESTEVKFGTSGARRTVGIGMSV